METLLLVDDDQDMRFLLRRELRDSGFEIIEAADGLEALKLTRKRRVDVVLSDVHMPRMWGTVLRDALLQQGFPRNRIFLMTGMMSNGLAVDFRKGDHRELATAFLAKVGRSQVS